MNLIVATRVDALHVRVEAEGRWQYGDALKLAYAVKAAGLRSQRDRFLVDVRRVISPPAGDEKFLICDRLERVFAPPLRVAVIAHDDFIDAPQDSGGEPAIAVFNAERDAVNWLLAP
ncbi:MAG: hypothetical protein HYX47_02550 [Burkholderiales bacterium]|nr:hypothetical protein [Burkholderiales bacterium]